MHGFAQKRRSFGCYFFRATCVPWQNRLYVRANFVCGIFRCRQSQICLAVRVTSVYHIVRFSSLGGKPNPQMLDIVQTKFLNDDSKRKSQKNFKNLEWKARNQALFSPCDYCSPTRSDFCLLIRTVWYTTHFVRFFFSHELCSYFNLGKPVKQYLNNNYRLI